MTYTYNFTGKIHPKRVGFEIGQPIPLYIKVENFDIEGQAKAHFENSEIEVIFESPGEYTGSQLETLKNYVKDAVQMVVDIYCYVNSYGYDVEITSVNCEALDISQNFSVRGEWNIDKNNKEMTHEFTNILETLSKQKYIFIKDVLADFRRAIRYPAMTAPHCYRAIETIRHFYFEDFSIEDENERRNDGWKNLRSTLNLERSDFDEIKKYAIPGRHGRYPIIEYEERESVMNFTRSIIDGVLEEIKNET